MSKFIDPVAVLALAEQKPTLVEVPEWGGHVYVRSITAAEASALEPGASRDESSRLALIVARCACDENGERIWKDADIPRLNKMPIAGIVRVAQAVGQLNALGDQEVAVLGEASVGGIADDSLSNSPVTLAG